MKMFRRPSILLLLPALLVLSLVGCGSSTETKGGGGATLTAASTAYPNSGLLVTGDSVQASIAAGAVATGAAGSNSGKLVIIDARTSGYDVSHIPGAISLNYGDYFTGGTGLKPLATLQTQLGAVGLSRGMKIVIYDNTSASWGAAGRVFWMLEYLGCTDVHILDGGWDKWVADGRAVQTTANTLAPCTFTATVNNDLLAQQGHILNRLRDSDFAVIDSRTDEEFNGWQLYGEARGGHIPGAVQIPYEWFYNSDKTTLSYQNLKKVFESRGITPDKEVTSYCTAGIRSGYVYFLLRLMGYPRCSNYDASMFEWSANTALPMEKLPNYSRLVSADWVKDLVDGKTVKNPPAGRYLIAATTSAKTVTTFIPGSIWIKPTEWELRGAVGGVVLGSGNLWPDATLQANIESWGIDKDTTVIIYYDAPGNPDAIAAARLWWALMYAGVGDVRIVNGGIDAWTKKGYPINATPAARVPVASFFGTATGLTFPLHPEYLATTADVEQVVAGNRPNTILADIRCMMEYIGGPNDYATIGIPLTAVGRIPGAKWGHWGPKTLLGGDFWDTPDGSFRNYTEVAQMWKDYGITPVDADGNPNTIIPYCGTGWRSSLAFFYGYLMGWNMKNYDGSFFEWAQTSPNAANHAIATGWPY